MRILFLSIGAFESINQHGIYPDLLREFAKHGHKIYVVCARERRTGLSTELIEEAGTVLLKVRIGNITRSNVLEKGISTVLIEQQYKAAIKKYFSHVYFDLILYSTPPITFYKVVDYVKKRDGAKTYLLLKDIFPQNAVDMGMISKVGIKGILYHYFRTKEKRLYRISDTIGCMSEANVKYVLKYNSEICKSKVEVCPNSIEVADSDHDWTEKREIRKKYNIPLEKKVFVYGGNLGKPQGVSFLIECLRRQQLSEAFFLIIGRGMEYSKLEEFVRKDKPTNVCLMNYVQKEEYDALVSACDVGMIFLDHRFTIPNFPSRLLGYMQAKLPILAVTDPHTDIGQVIVNGGFGWWCESNDSGSFIDIINKVIDSNLSKMGEKSFKYLKEHYDVKQAYETIMQHI